MRTPHEQAVRDAVINLAWPNSPKKRANLLDVVREKLDALEQEHRRALADARARGLEEAARIVEFNLPEAEVKVCDAREQPTAKAVHRSCRSLAAVIRFMKKDPEPPGMDAEPPSAPCSLCGDAHPDGTATGGIVT
ncbi:hypothetical protein [Archangium sp.]|uniref:hypothetical protein n=1 Tax=Archangium sp. TaxID=1872627 RepID=UPI00389A8015